MAYCSKCALHDKCITNNMPGRGRFGGIMVLGDFPSNESDEAGKAFAGPEGELLTALLSDAGLGEYALWRTNACRCFSSEDPKIQMIRACRSHLERELQSVAPVCIIAMGSVAAQAITDNHLSTVHKLRGQRLSFAGIPVCFTFPTGMLLKDRAIQKHLEQDLKDAAKWIKEGCSTAITKSPYHVEKLSNFSRTSLTEAAIDLETEGLDPYSGKIVSIAVCGSNDLVFYEECNCLPGSAKWLEVLQRLSDIDTLIFHNGTFDFAWMTKDVPFDHPIWQKNFKDSIITLQFYDEHYKNTSLAHLSTVYCELPKLPTPEFVSQGFPEGWRTKENRITLCKYNSRDAWVTYQLEQRLYGMIHEKSRKAYRWVGNNIPVAVQMRHEGIYLHQERLEELKRVTTKKMNFLEQRLRTTGVDWKSNKQLGEYLYEVKKYKVVKRTKKHAPSVDAEALQTLVDEGHDRTGFLKVLLKWREYSKIRDTYCAQFTRWGHIAHPKVFINRMEESGSKYGANTGRVTTEGFVNLPRGKKDEPESPYAVVKKVITSRYEDKGVIVQADGSQMEMRVLADQSRDEMMLQAFRNDEDLHRFVASNIYQIPKKEVTDGQRQVGKHYSFRTVYGGGSLESARKAGAIITEEEDRALTRVYFARFKGVARYIDVQHADAMRDKRVFSPIGRIFHLDNAIRTRDKDIRKSTNSPIQSAANDFTTEALKQVQRWILRMGYRAHVILTVYDSIIMDWHEDDWAKVDVEHFKREILTELPKSVMKRLGWEIICPMKWDLAIGRSLGDCK